MHALPNGITLHAAHWGDPAQPLMLFLHGFPEFWYAWRDLAPMFAGSHHCVAPDLRGFNLSSQPTEPGEYKAHKIVQDIVLLMQSLGKNDAVVVSHDWGGAVAWGLAIAQPQRVRQLVSINSPHPGTFARELCNSTAQQQASAYMLWLREPFAEQALAKDDYAKLKSFFTGMTTRAGWFAGAVERAYADCWSRGLTGGLNYYRATPLVPPTAAQANARAWQPTRDELRVTVPTLVIWGLADTALLPGLLDGLDDYVPQLQLQRFDDASHWIVHEHTAAVAACIRACLDRGG